jgi:hypothetical protein
MASKIAKLTATAVLASVAFFGKINADEIAVNNTNWINHPYYSDKTTPARNSLDNDDLFVLMTSSANNTNSVKRIESFDFKNSLDFNDFVCNPRKRVIGDRVEQTYYDVMDFKDDVTSGINRGLKSVGMKAKIDLKKFTLRLWEQKATERNVDFSRPSTLIRAFNKEVRVEDKYGKRYGAYITFTGYFDDFQQLFGFGK